MKLIVETIKPTVQEVLAIHERLDIVTGFMRANPAVFFDLAEKAVWLDFLDAKTDVSQFKVCIIFGPEPMTAQLYAFPSFAADQEMDTPAVCRAAHFMGKRLMADLRENMGIHRVHAVVPMNCVRGLRFLKSLTGMVETSPLKGMRDVFHNGSRWLNAAALELVLKDPAPEAELPQTEDKEKVAAGG
jgi:hypothetical protein